MKHFLKVSDFSKEELQATLLQAHAFKKMTQEGGDQALLRGKSLAMIFEKPSHRTRMAFEVGMFQLGGRAFCVHQHEVSFGTRESIPDAARTLSRFVDAVMIRANHHWAIDEFAKYGTVPVINGLSDHHHPCQALADLMTIDEHLGISPELKVVYIGDGNNVCNSLIEICRAFELQLVVCSPPGYEPLMKKEFSALTLTSSPEEAVCDADVIYTDVWTSMGQEASYQRRLKDFQGFRVTPELLERAKPSVLFMHCLPAKRGIEVDDAVIEGPRSVVFDQAENRLHTQKAVLVQLLASRTARNEKSNCTLEAAF